MSFKALTRSQGNTWSRRYMRSGVKVIAILYFDVYRPQSVNSFYNCHCIKMCEASRILNSSSTHAGCMDARYCHLRNVVAFSVTFRLGNTSYALASWETKTIMGMQFHFWLKIAGNWRRMTYDVEEASNVRTAVRTGTGFLLPYRATLCSHLALELER